MPARGLVIDRPNVFAVHDGFGIDAAGRLVGRKQTDILANDVAVRGAAGPEAFKARLSQGVLETALEREVLRRPAPGVNAAALFESAGTGRATWVKLASPDDPQLAALALGADTLARIRGDLRAGYTVVAPTAPVTVGQQSREGWWRIDPRDGTCIGFAADGFGSELAEFAIVLTSILIEAGMAFHCLDEGHGYGCIICFVIFAVLDVASFGQFSVGCSLVVAGANLGGSAACEAIAGALGD